MDEHNDLAHSLLQILPGLRAIPDPGQALEQFARALGELRPGLAPERLDPGRLAKNPSHGLTLLPLAPGLDHLGCLAVRGDLKSLSAKDREDLDNALLVLAELLARPAPGGDAGQGRDNPLIVPAMDLELAVQGSRFGTWDWDTATGEVRYGSLWAEILGFKPDEVSQDFSFWESRIHPEDHDRTLVALEDHLAGRTRMFRADHRLRTKSGEWIWMVGRGAVTVRNKDGTPKRVSGTVVDISERKLSEAAMEKRIVELTRPLEDASDIAFEELFDIADIQKLQDEFALATGVASIITRPDGSPITAPSNFCRLCKDIIRKTEKGLANCCKSDAVLGRLTLKGPVVQPCMSGGLWDAGAGISVGGRHIANWLIGQVRDETQSEEQMRAYARKIGADEDEVARAFQEVPAMTQERFKQVAQALATLAAQLSTMAYQNVQQARAITERKRAEEALRLSEVRYRLVADNTLDSIWAMDRNLSFTYLSPSTERLFGYTLAEWATLDWSRFVHPDYLDSLMELYGSLLHNPEPASVTAQTLVFSKNGQEMWVEFTATPVFGEDGDITGIVGVTRNVTERKLAEDALRDREAFINSVLESLPIGIAVNAVDPTVQFSFMNDNFPRFYRTSRDALAEPDAFWDAVYEDPAFREEIKARIWDDYASGDPDRLHWEDVPITRQGQETHFISAKNIPLPDKGLVVSTVWDVTERKRAEEALRKERDTMAQIMDTSPAGIVFVDKAGGVRFANSRAEAILGLEISSITERAYNDPSWKITAIDGSPLPDEKLPFQIAKNSKAPVFGIEHAIEWPDGRRVLVSVNAAPLFNQAGEFDGMVASIEDITDRKKADHALQESEERFRVLFENSVMGIALHDMVLDDHGKAVDYVITGVNSAFSEILGLSADRAVGEKASELYGANEPPYLDIYAGVAAGGAPVLFETFFPPLDKHFQITAFSLKPGSFATTFLDVTDLKVAQQEVNRIFEMSLDLICIGDINTFHFKRINPAFTSVLGYPEHELLGKPFTDFIHPDDVERTIKMVKTRLRTGALVIDFENRFRHQDGSYRWLNWVSQPLPDKGVTYAIARDVTEQKAFQEEVIRARDAAESASRAKSEFLANMSHEIRTPLNGIMGMLQLLQRTELGDEQQEYADTALQSSRRLTGLLSDILDLSMVEAGKLGIRNEPLDLPHTLRQVIELFQPTAQQTGVALRHYLDPDIPRHLLGDSARLQQVLINLIGNAFKFTQRGFISLEAYPLPMKDEGRHRVLFTVTDTGMGIPDHKLDMLFEPFTQVSEGYTRQFQGAGLGLSICKRLVNLMGGEIAIASQEGEGTSVHFCITCGRKASPAYKDQARNGAGSDQSLPRRVLLAEDDMVSAFAARRQLEMAGCEVMVVDDGAKVLDALRQEDFDVVLMDVQMPEMDGMEATRAIRRGEAGEHKASIPIIALTAYAMAGDEDRFLAAGMDSYAAKPLEMQDLLDALMRVKPKR